MWSILVLQRPTIHQQKGFSCPFGWHLLIFSNINSYRDTASQRRPDNYETDLMFWNQRVRTKNWVRSLLNGDNFSNLLTSSLIVVIFLAQYFAGIWWLVTRFELYLFLVRLPRVLAFHTTIAQYIRLYSNKLDLAKSKSSWCDDIKIYESFSV